MLVVLKSLQKYVEDISDRTRSENFNIIILSDDNQVLNQINEIQVKSNIIIAYEFFSPFDNENYFVFCFENTMILLLQNDILKIKQFIINSKSTIYCLTNTRDKIIKLCKSLNYHFSFVDDLLYDEEIAAFIHELNLPGVKDIKIVNVCKVILRCISSFLIKKAYLKTNINRIKSYFNNKDEFFNNKNMNQYNYEMNCKYLKTINSTNSSCISLLYDDDNEQLIVKKAKTQKEKLYNREKQIYKDLKHPLISKYYGFYEDKIEKTLFIEFINGCTLSEIKTLNLSDDEKYNIIFEILITFQYLHSKGLVYRDLKPNNVMIDKNKIAVLIDFDQIITESRASNESLEKNK